MCKESPYLTIVWSAGILNEYWGRKMSSLLNKEVNSWYDSCFIFQKYQKYNTSYILHTWNEAFIKQWFGATDSVFALNQVKVDYWDKEKGLFMTIYTYICNKYTQQIKCLILEGWINSVLAVKWWHAS